MAPRQRLAIGIVVVILLVLLALIGQVTFLAPMFATPPSTPTRTATPTNTSTPTPTATMRPTPTQEPLQLSPPFVSSSGQLAYVQDGCLFVAEIDGQTTMIAEDVVCADEGTVWSPDSRRLLYVTERESHLEHHIWDSATRSTLHLEQEVLGFPPEHWIGNVVWAPDGRRLLLGTFTYLEEAPPVRSISGLWALDVETHRLWEVVDIGPGSVGVEPVWIDQDTLLYDRSCGLSCWLGMVHVGPPARPLTMTTDLFVVTGGYALSPDRRYLASRKFINYDGETWPWQLQVVPLPGNPPLTSSPHPVMVGFGSLLWSPDSRWIACGAPALDGSGQDGPYTVVVDTTEISATQIITGLLPQAWSPDSHLIAGWTCLEPDCDLAITDVKSGQIVSLAADRPFRWSDLAWSPSGSYLAYSLSGPDSSPWKSVHVWDRTTGNQHTLMGDDEPGRFTDLQWTPDGSWLFFAQRGRWIVTGEAPHPVRAIWRARPDDKHPLPVAP
jgi:dipeptidyl aminopeptidase/acylaminoacyl peptidase